MAPLMVCEASKTDLESHLESGKGRVVHVAKAQKPVRVQLFGPMGCWQAPPSASIGSGHVCQS